MTRAHGRVRPATSEDVPALAALVRVVDPAAYGRACGESDDVAPLCARLGELLAGADRTLLVALDDQGEVAGMLCTQLDEVGSIELTRVLHITHLMVSPKQRRRGLGRALLAAAVSLADEAGVENVLTTSSAGSREGNRYLARIGFAPLVVNRIAPVATLRRTLGMTDPAGKLAVLRRARLARAQRTGFGHRPVGRGA